MHSAKDGHRRGDREGARQGVPSQNPCPKPNTGGALGGQKRVTDTNDKQQFPARNLQCEQAASKARRGYVRNQANRGKGINRGTHGTARQGRRRGGLQTYIKTEV